MPFPHDAARPHALPWRSCSARAPLCVHAPASTPRSRVEDALVALQDAWQWLQAQGWSLPYPDGGAGQTQGFDVYLEPSGALGAAAHAEHPLAWTDLDAATSYATIGGAPLGAELAACAIVALAQAGLIATDPAEDILERAAIAALAAWQGSGVLGCPDTRPALATVSVGPHDDGAGDERVSSLALWLAHLSRSPDGADGDFVRDLWDVARQRSRSRSTLRTRPDFWQALEALLKRDGHSLERAAEEFAVARWFWPASDAALPALASAHRLVEAQVHANEQPQHHRAQRALAPYAHAYIRVQVAHPKSPTQLRVWLQSDLAARFGLTAVRLGDRGRDLGRVSSPGREGLTSFLPIELTADTREVLLVVTRLPLRRPGRPAPDDELGYRLLFETR